MKKLFFIAAIIIYGSTFGQEINEKLIIKKGTFVIGGKASFSIANSENEDNTSGGDYNRFEISPNFGYTIKNNLIVGLGLGYSYAKSKSYNTNNSVTDTNDSTYDGFNIFPYVKKYIPLGKKLTMYLQGEFRYSENKSTQQYSNLLNNNSDGVGKTFFVGFRPGISYFLNKKLAMEVNLGALGYSSSKTTSSSDYYYKSNTFNFSLNSSELQFGLSYYF